MLTIILIKAIFPLKNFTMDIAASAMASLNSLSVQTLLHTTFWLAVFPPECWYDFPAEEPNPIDNCFRAPPNPPIWCPLKWEITKQES